MKSNHIPVETRLKKRILDLELRAEKQWIRKDPNPYLICKSCNRSIPEISNLGHGKGCKNLGLIKEITHYKYLLESKGDDF